MVCTGMANGIVIDGGPTTNNIVRDNTLTSAPGLVHDETFIKIVGAGTDTKNIVCGKIARSLRTVSPRYTPNPAEWPITIRCSPMPVEDSASRCRTCDLSQVAPLLSVPAWGPSSACFNCSIHSGSGSWRSLWPNAPPACPISGYASASAFWRCYQGTCQRGLSAGVLVRWSLFVTVPVPRLRGGGHKHRVEAREQVTTVSPMQMGLEKRGCPDHSPAPRAELNVH